MPSDRIQRRLERLLDQAEEAIDSRDWQAAQEYCRAALALDPGNEDAASLLSAAGQAVSVVNLEQIAAEPEVKPGKSSELTGSSNPGPTSFASGRYTVSKFLGEGGKKRVYLAHDNTLDRDVAFALIKIEGLDETSRERVKREAQAMGRMGTHPCIMPIYDLGEETDASGVAQPFMVQPLMSGGDVEGLVEDAEGPLELDRALEIATQTAQGLSFAHSKGIIHRDLKPGNVWLDENGAAKIGDFGLAVATDRSRLTVEKVMVGTVSYMPPEQATGGEVTPRADLYSLGAMLYEMSTGRVPFMGDDDIAIISQHVNTPPVAPSWHNSKIPKTLDSLVMRLLAKDPAERPESADEVLSALQAVDLTAVEEREAGSKGSLDAMAGGVFVGRHREMDQLKSIFEGVLSGKGRMVTLVGEPGIGKTRTAQELATYASMRGAEVLWGRSYESGGAPPYWPWVQAIRSHVSATEPETLRNQLGSAATVIADVVSDIKAKLPDLPAPSLIEDPESARFRLFDSIATFLKNVSGNRPLVVMLEDLHWSDKPSLTLLEFVARELANSRILIVGNYRDMELNRRHPLSVTLGDLSRERLFERVVLRGLQKHDVQRFIEIAAGISPPSALVDTVHSQTEGNPLFVTETVRLLIQEGDITSGQSSKGGTTSWEIRIPEGVREVIGRRLDRLSERCNEVLTIAAVVGRQFRFPVLLNLSEDVSENMLLDVMDEALSARVVEELPGEVGLYQFTHALMQETLTSELSSNRKVRLHARIAEALEDYWGDDAGQHTAELAEHFAEAETVLGIERLVKYCLLAGNQSFEAHANDAAVGHFSRGLSAMSQLPMDEIKASLTFGRARSLADTIAPSEMQQVIDALREAFDFYVATGQKSKAVRVAATPVPTIAELTGITDMLGSALSMVASDSLEAGRMLSRYGIGLFFEHGATDKALAAMDEAARIAQINNNEVAEMWALTNRITVLTHTMELSNNLNLIPRAIEMAQKTENPSAECQTRFPAVMAYAIAGKPEMAREHAIKGVQLAEKYGLTYRLISALSAAARIAMFEGDWQSARELTDRAFDIDKYDHRLLYVRIEVEHQTGNFEAGKDFLARLQQAVDQGLTDIEYGRISLALHTAMQSIAKGESGGSEEVGKYIQVVKSVSIRPQVIAIGDNLERFLAIPPGERRLTDVLDPITRSISEFQKSTDDERFEHVIGFCREHGYGPTNANFSFDYSDWLLDRNASGDREKAIELQDEAISIATEFGMKPLLERVLAKREILKA